MLNVMLLGACAIRPTERYEAPLRSLHLEAAHEAIARGRYADAEPSLLLALKEAEAQALRLESANILMELGMLYRLQARYGESEPPFRQALSGFEAIQPRSPFLQARIGRTLEEFGRLRGAQGRFDESERLIRQALATAETGGGGWSIAHASNALGWLYLQQRRDPEAEPHLKRALSITDGAKGKSNAETRLNEYLAADVLVNLGDLYRLRGEPATAEPLLRRALTIRDKMLDPEHPEVATTLGSLGAVYLVQGRYADADPVLRRALEIREKRLGSDHPEVADALEGYAVLLQKTGRGTEASAIDARAKEIRRVRSEQGR